ncbi:MAG TPA: response regulator transcription factor [Candidatus Acidoferrales bacterium]|nr:response regulator transcription factor [Candidatus Acidoferrales bacterium]HEV3481586.1 response regulator transcription factor [Candidatus Acidoferrales bacterium]
MDRSAKVYILSDNRLFRESLARICSKKSDIEVISTRQLGLDVLEEVFNSNADILLLDSAAFLVSAAGHFARQRVGGRCTKILLVGMEDDGMLFLQSVRCGVSGYIPKEASAMDVVAAVRSVAQGEAVCSPRLCKFLFDIVARQSAEAPRRLMTLDLGLTRREQELIPLIDKGLTNKEIASQLYLSEQTIKNHVHRILRKVGVVNRLSVSEACRVREPRLSENLPLA